MKTIFIITTREYPIDNTTQFQDISGYYNENNDNYITQQEWGDYFRADAWDQTWVDDKTKNMRVEQPLPIKKGEIEGLVFYVAPCLNKDVAYHNYDNKEYIKKIISAVKKDIKEETYRIILIVHDHDMNDDQPCVHRASGDKIILEDKEVKGCISYQHEPPNNKNVKCKENSETISLEYDIYEAFILHLNDVGGITKDKCDKLNKILFQLDITQEVEEIKVTDCSEITAKNEELEGISNSSLQEDEKSNSNNPDSLKILDYDRINGDEWNYVLGVSFVPVITKLSMPLENLQSNHRYKNVLDSSIWFYAYSNEEELKEIKQQIADNKPRYDLDVAHEYREFYHRMLKNSYTTGSHKEVVSPFLFHSEQELKKKIDEHKQIIDNIKQYKWRILLVDDHVGDTKMKLSSGEESTLTKLDIVKTELENLFKNIATEKDNKTFIIATEENTEDIKKNANIYIECASSIKEAKEKLEKKKYEIILLDYLLGEKGGGREYGYELLDWISKQEKAAKANKNAKFDYKKGPDNRLFFMFISAFTTAVSERLLTQGWLRSEDYWYIGEGACPINTPYLFQYRLLHIMEKRMKDMGLAKWNVKEQETKDNSAKNKQDQPSNETDIYTELINEIYAGDGVRKRANEKFQDVLDLLYHYKNLLLDTDMPSDNVFDSAESVLATDFVMNHMDYEGVLEHLTQLVYLTAFGTVRQWSEMWEEYQYIKSYLGRIQCVEDFIVNLKNNSVK